MNEEKPKILLALLPFWDPQIPPLGLACHKSFLQHYGYTVSTVDANLEVPFREIHDDYFGLLDRVVPDDKKANLYNIGYQVLQNHLMAHQHKTNDWQYWELLKILVEKTFYYELADVHLKKLDEIIQRFYAYLKTYLLALLEKEKPAVFGLSVYSGTLPASMFAFKLAKELNPAIKNLMGGGIFSDQLAVGSPNLDAFLKKTESFIDKLFVGEGEQLFYNYLAGTLDDSKRLYGRADLNNQTLDMEIVAPPDFSDFQLQHYPHIAHYGSRSCPFQCNFCSETINWGKYRKKKIEQVVKEMVKLTHRYDYQLFLMTDSLLNPIASDLAEEIIKSGESIYWDGFLRADRHVADIKNTLLWRRGGFYRAKLGLESGSPHVLELMDKKISVEQIKQAVKSLAYAGIKTTTFWLFGFPGETEEDFQLTMNLVEELKDFIYEADCNAFNYYLTGQANSSEWSRQKASLLYPEWAADMLVSQTWFLDGEPRREVSYERLNRFCDHLKKLNIPNPYTLKDIYLADERWIKLHQNAVPGIVEFKNLGKRVHETEKVKTLAFANNTMQDDDEWL